MKKYTNQEGINLNTFKILFENKEEATIDMQVSKGLYEVDMFTFYKHNLISTFIHTFIINPIVYPNIQIKGFGKYEYKSKSEQFSFILLSKYFKKIFESDKYILKELTRNYKEAARASTCQYSIILAYLLNNSKLVIGQMPLKDGRMITHRFVEIEKNGQVYVLDIAKNIIMKQDDYYQISKFILLDKIDSEDLKVIYNFCNENKFCNHTGIISMFGNEILNELNKNNLIKTRVNKIPNFNGLIN